MTDWPHSPVHRLADGGAYMVTAGTYLKQHVFRDPRRLTVFQDQLLALATKYGWALEAWAVFSNHYHFVAKAPADPGTLSDFLRHLHSETSREVNRLDRRVGRQVWHEFWETHLTYEKSYLARLRYTHENPVRHGLVTVATAYPWCSARWFARTAPASFVRTLQNFKIDRVNVADPFEVRLEGVAPTDAEAELSSDLGSG